MSVLRYLLPVLLVASLIPAQAQAANNKTPPKKVVPKTAPKAVAKAVAPAPVVVAIPTPADVVDAFHEALRTRNRDVVVALMSQDAWLFENGFVEVSRDDYVKNHLSDDVEFARVTDYKPTRRRVTTDGQTALVLTQAIISGLFGDQDVDLEQTETMILRRTQTSWEIMHLHWSAHPRQTDAAEQDALPVPPEIKAEQAPAGDAKSSAVPTVPVRSEVTPEDIKKP
ncbi:MAG: nuclear transport factor 2 family protein [Pseudomonadota bacterium]